MLCFKLTTTVWDVRRPKRRRGVEGQPILASWLLITVPTQDPGKLVWRPASSVNFRGSSPPLPVFPAQNLTRRHAHLRSNCTNQTINAFPAFPRRTFTHEVCHASGTRSLTPRRPRRSRRTSSSPPEGSSTYSSWVGSYNLEVRGELRPNKSGVSSSLGSRWARHPQTTRVSPPA